MSKPVPEILELHNGRLYKNRCSKQAEEYLLEWQKTHNVPNGTKVCVVPSSGLQRVVDMNEELQSLGW